MKLRCPMRLGNSCVAAVLLVSLGLAVGCGDDDSSDGAAGHAGAAGPPRVAGGAGKAGNAGAGGYAGADSGTGLNDASAGEAGDSSAGGPQDSGADVSVTVDGSDGSVNGN